MNLNNIILITVATQENGYLQALREGCERASLPLIILGFGEKWRGFTWRTNLIKDYVNKLRDDMLVVCIDAYDVLCLVKNKSSLIDRYNLYGKDIILSVEGPYENDSYKNLISNYVQNKVFGECENTRLNAGCYMGRVSALKIFFNLWLNGPEIKDETDDQKQLTSVCNINNDWFKKHVAFDTKKIIFYIHGCLLYDSELINNGRSMTYNGYEPCFIHGSGNCNMRDICDVYKFTHSKGRDQYYINVIKHYSKFFVLEIVIFALIILFLIYSYYKL